MKRAPPRASRPCRYAKAEASSPGRPSSGGGYSPFVIGGSWRSSPTSTSRPPGPSRSRPSASSAKRIWEASSTTKRSNSTLPRPARDPVEPVPGPADHGDGAPGQALGRDVAGLRSTGCHPAFPRAPARPRASRSGGRRRSRARAAHRRGPRARSRSRRGSGPRRPPASAGRPRPGPGRPRAGPLRGTRSCPCPAGPRPGSGGGARRWRSAPSWLAVIPASRPRASASSPTASGAAGAPAKPAGSRIRRSRGGSSSPSMTARRASTWSEV